MTRQSTGPLEAECPHGKPYLYEWVWDSGKGETEETSEPFYITQPDCVLCYPEDEDD